MSSPAPVGYADAIDARDRLSQAGYLTDRAVATVAFLATRLGKPVLAEGPAGVGKTELAKAMATSLGAGLVRLQCYEGLDEAKALYEWNYRKQLLRIQAEADADWSATEATIFSDDYLLDRPLLTALRRDEPTLLLVDEVDKVDFEFEALLLEILSDFQVTIPEMGTVAAVRRPAVVLTSNATRELSEALKRRCLYLHLGFPEPQREAAIVARRVPEASERLAEQLVKVVASLRELELAKPPSVAETVDWARALVAIGVDTVDDPEAGAALPALLKHAGDVTQAYEHLGLSSGPAGVAGEPGRN
jgi:MoxR-like ATPase